MATELNLTKKETAALDRIEAELKSSTTRGMAKTEASVEGIGDLCEKYKAIKAALRILVKILRKLGTIGNKAADAIEFLMGLADTVCPA